MITHIMKDGTVKESIAGTVIRSEEFPVLYKILEGGEANGKSVSASEGRTGSSERPEPLCILP